MSTKDRIHFMKQVRDMGFDRAIDRAIGRNELIGITSVGEYHVLFAFADKGFVVFRESAERKIDHVEVLDDIVALKGYLDGQDTALWGQATVVRGDYVGVRFDSYFNNAPDDIPATGNHIQ